MKEWIVLMAMNHHLIPVNQIVHIHKFKYIPTASLITDERDLILIIAINH